MAPSPIQISIFLLLTLFSSIHARDSQFFNKNPSTTKPNTVPDTTLPEQDQPDFLPDNDNAYGLYGHGSATDSDSDQPPRKYLPKNYNPVAYVTEPEDINDNGVSFTENHKTYATNPTNYFNGQKDQDESFDKSYPTTTAAGDSFYYNGGSSFNSDPDRFNRNYFDHGAGADGYQPEGLEDTRLFGARENNFDNGAGADGYLPEGTDAKMLASRGNYFDAGASVNGFQPQGMSDTRALEKGKYFYDVNSEKYSTDHPYERLRGARPTYSGDREVNGEFP